MRYSFSRTASLRRRDDRGRVQTSADHELRGEFCVLRFLGQFRRRILIKQRYYYVK